MTPLFPDGKNPQTIALAFAVASLQNPAAAAAAMEGLQLQQQQASQQQQQEAGLSIPQTLLDAAAAAASASSHFQQQQRSVVSPPSFSDQKVSAAPTEQPKVEIAMGDSRSRSNSSLGDEDSVEPQPGTAGEDDNERRLARSRERNREHARRTRLRKKAQLEALQSKVKTLEAERQVLKQKVEECGIASILLGLSAGSVESAPAATDAAASGTSLASSTDMVAILSGSKRKRFISEAIGEQPGVPQQQRLVINIDGQVTEIGAGKSHINWKTGVYRDQQGVQRQLTPQQLEDLRRERNRMHAKMTRSRKKCFIATIQKAIDELEAENQRMRDLLDKAVTVSALSSAAAPPTSMVTPAVSPRLAPKQAPCSFPPHDDDDFSQAVTEPSHDEAKAQSSSDDSSVPTSEATKLFSSFSRGPLKKRKNNPAPAPHGFLLDG
eukprot:CAMPEP_0172439070 /NCGR_PEP_ID=MMETSP1065-20121228/173_1 /TAXON_ID=265537 /ORGANISM="Amphiprora paludosa, Strain CCMP125" /LENGTH=436 /DNA_ID=CAMNT_0013187697 /DNA_START=8 /DNA_END=1318 /DNA_ORIENTATION=-